MDFIDQITVSIQTDCPDCTNDSAIIEIACLMASAVESGFVSCEGMNHFTLSDQGVRFVEALLETDDAKALFKRVIGVTV